MKRTRFTTFATLAALTLALGAGWATAQTAKPASHATDSGFSFAVYGDSRSMMYLPYKSDQEAEARELMADMFELVLPENVAEEVIKKDVKLIYDPATHELVEMVMPFMTHSEVTYLTVDKGWITEASVEDVKLLPGVRRTMFRLHGPPDLYWKGAPPKEEYNFLLVDVQPGQKTKFTLNRFRPWSAEPFATVELFGASK
jgi:hypothetical protein